MTKDKFINFIKDNRHKFVFISYRGGMGGETMCNHLAQESDYFYNETLMADMLANKEHIFDNFYMETDRIILQTEDNENNNRQWF